MEGATETVGAGITTGTWDDGEAVPQHATGYRPLGYGPRKRMLSRIGATSVVIVASFRSS